MAAPTKTPSMSMMCDCSIGHGLSDGDERTRSWDRSDDAGGSATSGRAAWLAHQNGDRSSHGLPFVLRRVPGSKLNGTTISLRPDGAPIAGDRMRGNRWRSTAVQ
jgi:hypothetical protein